MVVLIAFSSLRHSFVDLCVNVDSAWICFVIVDVTSVLLAFKSLALLIVVHGMCIILYNIPIDI